MKRLASVVLVSFALSQVAFAADQAPPKAGDQGTGTTKVAAEGTSGTGTGDPGAVSGQAEISGAAIAAGVVVAAGVAIAAGSGGGGGSSALIIPTPSHH
jgi:hypothetical protein